VIRLDMMHVVISFVYCQDVDANMISPSERGWERKISRNVKNA